MVVAQIFTIFPGKQNYFWNMMLVGWRESSGSFHLDLLAIIALTPSVKEQLLNIPFPTMQCKTMEITIEWLHQAIGLPGKLSLAKILCIT